MSRRIWGWLFRSAPMPMWARGVVARHYVAALHEHLVRREEIARQEWGAGR